ncbi:MAG: TRAP transporter small permease [Betaproteobacteria bacterium]
MLDKADRALERSIFYGSALLMLALTGVILYAVVARYFFNRAPIWSEEVPRVIFLWVSYLAAAVAVRRGQSLRITFLLERMPPAARLVCELSMHVSIVLMLGFLFWHNLPVIELSGQTRMLATQWKDAVRFWPLSVGCVLIALYEIRFLIQAVRDHRERSGR